MAKRTIPTNEIIGKKFNRWTILSEADRYILPSGKKLRMMNCICDCGTKRSVLLNSIMTGNSKSCGCFMIETTKKTHTKHGNSGLAGKSRLYNIWANMKSRCYYEGNTRFDDYGERGITVSEEWQEFIPFQKWALNNGYSDDKFIDRKNVDLGYCKSNCRFVSIGLNNRNTRLLRKTNTSGYRGVYFANGKYIARITTKRKDIHLGCFKGPITAAKAYDKAARKLNDGRPLNFP